jgi:hypothetical protein
MAALTLPEALKRTRSPAMGMIAKAISTTDAFGAVVPFKLIDGTAERVDREGTLPDTAFIADDGSTGLASSTGTDDVTHVPVRRIVSDLDVDALADDLTGPSPGSQRGRQVQKKVKATWRKIKDKLVNGAHVTSHTLGLATNPFNAIDAIDYGPWLDSSRFGPGAIKYTHTGTLWQFRAPGDVDYGTAVECAADGTFTLRSWNESKFIIVTLDVSDATQNGETSITFSSTSREFDGLIEMCDPGQLIEPVAANGDDFALNLLDKMMRYEKVKTNRAFIMHTALEEQFYSKMRALGGADIRTMAIPGYGSEVPVYRGIPILGNDNIGLDETVGTTTDATSIYLASLDTDEGLYLAAAGGANFDADGDPRSRVVMGFRIVDLGDLEAADHRRTRVKWYGTPVLRSKLALVRKSGVKSS